MDKLLESHIEWLERRVELTPTGRGYVIFAMKEYARKFHESFNNEKVLEKEKECEYQKCFDCGKSNPSVRIWEDGEKLKCYECHKADVYDVTTHTGHDAGSAGAVYRSSNRGRTWNKVSAGAEGWGSRWRPGRSRACAPPPVTTSSPPRCAASITTRTSWPWAVLR